MDSCEATLKALLLSYESYQKKKDVGSKPVPVFALLQHLESSGLRIKCKICTNDGTEGSARAYLVDQPFQIVLCANRLQSADIEEVLSHEATHAFDLHYNRCNFNSCQGLAHTEVRAAKNGECASLLPRAIVDVFPGVLDTFPFSSMREECVKKHATRSTANLFPLSQAKICVDEVYVAAMADNSPSEKS